MDEYMLHVPIKGHVMSNDKSGGKPRRFSEEYPKCRRFYKTI